jgi:hypothetical protein
MGLRKGNATQPFETLPEFVEDEASRESHDRLRQFFDGLLMARFDGDHFEITFDSNGAIQYPHNFRYVPKDLWLTSQTGDAATVTVNYNDFDNTNLDFTIAGLGAGESVTIRFFAGVFRES